MMYLRNAWYAAGFTTDLAEGVLRPLQIIGEPVVLFRRADGAASALEDRCSHRGAPLSLGRIEGDTLRCLYHGLRFNAAGRCVEVPGQPQVTDSLHLRAYPVCERDGWLWVWMGDAALADTALVPPAMGLTDERWTLGGSYMDYDADYVLINDNLCDFSHLAYVHVNSFGGGNEEQLSDFAGTRPKVEQLDRGIRVTRWTTGRDAPPFMQGFEGQKLDSYMTYDYLAPGVLLMWNGIFPGGTAEACGYAKPTLEPLHANFTSQAVSAIDERRTRYYFTWGPSTRENRPFLKDFMVQLAVLAFEEDRRMIEAQQRVHAITPNLRMNPIVHDRGPNLMRAVMGRLMAEERREPSAQAA